MWRRRDSGDEERILLKPKAFAILLYLVDHTGRHLLAWVASFGVSAMIEHLTACFVLAAIPVRGFEAMKGVAAAVPRLLLSSRLLTSSAHSSRRG
jgi:hypothetical protein